MNTNPLVPKIASTTTHSRKRPAAQRRTANTYPPSLYQLEEYMRYRAASEGVPWQLDIAFLYRCYDVGVRTFFGVTLNHHQLLADAQQPKMFADWQRSGLGC
jgi:hypothetical protein